MQRSLHYRSAWRPTLVIDVTSILKETVLAAGEGVYLMWKRLKIMSSESGEKSKLEQSFESGAEVFGLALAGLTGQECLHFLITLGDIEGRKTVYH